MIMTNKPKKQKEDKVEKPIVSYVETFCVLCSEKFRAYKKDDEGFLIKQQLCPHTILEEVKTNAR